MLACRRGQRADARARLFAGPPIYGVIGGFHLAGTNERHHPRHGRSVRGFGLSVIAPGALHRLARDRARSRRRSARRWRRRRWARPIAFDEGRSVMEHKRVGIFIYEEVEVLDFWRSVRGLLAMRVNEARRREEPSPFLPALVAKTLEPVTATGGMRVLPTHAMSDRPALRHPARTGGMGDSGTSRTTRASASCLRQRASQAEVRAPPSAPARSVARPRRPALMSAPRHGRTALSRAPARALADRRPVLQPLGHRRPGVHVGWTSPPGSTWRLKLVERYVG